MKTCRECDKLNREYCYPTAPPQYDCTITGKCHFLDHVCDVNEEIGKPYDSSKTCGICENSTPFGIYGMVKCTKTNRYLPCEHKCDLKGGQHGKEGQATGRMDAE